MWEFDDRKLVGEDGGWLTCIHLSVVVQIFRLMSEPLSLDRDSSSSLNGMPADPPPKPAGIASTLSAAGRFIGQKVLSDNGYTTPL
jgi:hypothetical protein